LSGWWWVTKVEMDGDRKERGEKGVAGVMQQH
jgi:hypothetical protein